MGNTTSSKSLCDVCLIIMIMIIITMTGTHGDDLVSKIRGYQFVNNSDDVMMMII